MIITTTVGYGKQKVKEARKGCPLELLVAEECMQGPCPVGGGRRGPRGCDCGRAAMILCKPPSGVCGACVWSGLILELVWASWEDRIICLSLKSCPRQGNFRASFWLFSSPRLFFFFPLLLRRRYSNTERTFKEVNRRNPYPQVGWCFGSGCHPTPVFLHRCKHYLLYHKHFSLLLHRLHNDFSWSYDSFLKGIHHPSWKHSHCFAVQHHEYHLLLLLIYFLGI